MRGKQIEGKEGEGTGEDGSEWVSPLLILQFNYCVVHVHTRWSINKNRLPSDSVRSGLEPTTRPLD